jgi:hypothetical protein
MRGEGHQRLPLSSRRIGDDVGESGGWGSIDAFYVTGGCVVVVVIVMGGKGGGGTLSVCHRRRHCRAAFYRAAWETMWGREGSGGTEMNVAGGEVVWSSLSKGGMRGGGYVVGLRCCR